MRALGYVLTGIASLTLGTGLAFADDMRGTAERAMERAGGAVKGAGEEMRGTVKSIDRTDGQVRIESGGQEYDLEVPPSSLTNIEQGDQVTVTIRETSPRTQHGDAPSERDAPRTPPTGAGAAPGSSSRGVPDSPTGDR
jgi:hypothetical protein